MKKFFLAIILTAFAFCLILTNTNSFAFASNENITQINSPGDFLNISGNNTYSLSCDLDFSKTIYSGIANFSGTILGNGHKISNITIHGTTTGAMFQNLTNATISNLEIENFKSVVSGNSATLALNIENSNLENLTITNSNISGNTAWLLCASATNSNFKNIAIVSGTKPQNILPSTNTNCTFENINLLCNNKIYSINDNFQNPVFEISSLPNFSNYNLDLVNSLKTEYSKLVASGFKMLEENLNHLNLILEFDGYKLTNIANLTDAELSAHIALLTNFQNNFTGEDYSCVHALLDLATQELVLRTTPTTTETESNSQNSQNTADATNASVVNVTNKNKNKSSIYIIIATIFVAVLLVGIDFVSIAKSKKSKNKK